MSTSLPPAARGQSVAAGRGGQSYWAASRAHRYSLVFALPLLLAYELLAAALEGSRGATGVRNGADVILKGLFVSAAGARGPMIFMAIVIAASLWLVRRDRKRSPGGWPR
jgi:hypothetical protein